MSNKTNAERMMALFRGLDRAYGEFRIIEEPGDDSPKRKGKAITHKQSLTINLWEAHLAGTFGLGIIPVTDEGTCGWVCIDIDVYPVDLVFLALQLSKLGIPAVICQSKSGGAHLFIFFRTMVPTELARRKAHEIAAALGYPSAEVFPKQNTLANKNDVGNWLNMPYFGGTRQMIEHGEPRSIDYFLDYAEAMSITQEELERMSMSGDDAELDDAPPCIQKLCRDGFAQGTRNEGMFSVGVYLRRKYPDDWHQKVYEFNNRYFTPPLDPPEIMNVTRSLERKDYFYRCNTSPCKDHCSKELCKTRKYGIGGSAGLSVVIGNLSKLAGDPPIWYLEIDGHRIELSTKELMSFPAVKSRCIEDLTRHIGGMKPAEWDRLISEKVANAEVIEIPEDAGTLGQFKVLVNEFLTGGAKAKTKDDILNGLPWLDDNTGMYHFRSTDLEEFLSRRNFRRYTTTQVYAKLRDLGAQPDQFKLKQACVRHWKMPAIYAPQTEEFEVAHIVGESF